jgi:integrase
METNVDIINESRGTSAQSHDRIVQQHFVRFTEGKTVAHFKHRPDSELRELFGKFANYLFGLKLSTGSPKWGPAMNYLSSLAQVFKKQLFNNELGIFSNQEWYKTVRQTLNKKYVKQAQEDGEALVESPDDLTADLLEAICEFLYAQNTPKAMNDRAYISIMWNLLGRVSEIGYLRDSDISVHGDIGAIMVELTRTKGGRCGKSSKLAIFVQRNGWKRCALHCLGAALMTSSASADPKEHLLENVPRGEGVATYINAIFKAFLKASSLDLNLSSSSGRHGSAGMADSNADISITWIAQRGEWLLDRLCTAFEYITGSSSNDQKVARVLAGWKDVKWGGLPPRLEAVGPDALVKLQDIAKDLFPRSISNELQYLLMAVQLFRFTEVRTFNPGHIVVKLIYARAQCYEITMDQLENMCQAIYSDFQARNLPFLSSEDTPHSVAERLVDLTRVIQTMSCNV